MYNFKGSVGQESQQLHSVLWLRVSHKAAIKVLVRAVALSEGSTGEGHFKVTHMTGLRPSKHQFPQGPLNRAVHNLSAGFSLRECRESEKD